MGWIYCFILRHKVLWQHKLYLCAFLDYLKAIHYVVGDNLWYKLLKLRALDKMFNIIQSIYPTIKSITDSFDCTLGARQGDNLPPFLFSMYVNDLEVFLINNVLYNNVLLYADDGVLLAQTSTAL